MGATSEQRHTGKCCGLSDSQNVYDNPEFFAGYSQMERFGAGWSRALEQPTFLGMLPNVQGLRVLDLGCGLGQLSYHIANAGAAEVVAVDISQTMLERARTERIHPHGTYQREAIEDLRFEPGRFGLIVSSLALHYVANYRDLVKRMAIWLTPAVCSCIRPSIRSTRLVYLAKVGYWTSTANALAGGSTTIFRKACAKSTGL